MYLESRDAMFFPEIYNQEDSSRTHATQGTYGLHQGTRAYIRKSTLILQQILDPFMAL